MERRICLPSDIKGACSHAPQWTKIFYRNRKSFLPIVIDWNYTPRPCPCPAQKMIIAVSPRNSPPPATKIKKSSFLFFFVFWVLIFFFFFIYKQALARESDRRSAKVSTHSGVRSHSQSTLSRILLPGSLIVNSSVEDKLLHKKPV